MKHCVVDKNNYTSPKETKTKALFKQKIIFCWREKRGRNEQKEFCLLYDYFMQYTTYCCCCWLLFCCRLALIKNKNCSEIRVVAAPLYLFKTKITVLHGMVPIKCERFPEIIYYLCTDVRDISTWIKYHHLDVFLFLSPFLCKAVSSFQLLH